MATRLMGALVLASLSVGACGNVKQGESGGSAGNSGASGGGAATSGTSPGGGTSGGSSAGAGQANSNGGATTGGQGDGSGGAATGGQAGSSGGAEAGGRAGSSGGAEVGGQAGSSGAAPGGGSGAGTAGEGGEQGDSGECTVDADCVVVDDCCDCSATPNDHLPPLCSQVCIQGACAAGGLSDVQAVCRSRRCVLDVSCDRSKVQCRAATPECGIGMVPSVLGTCWGPCVRASDCREVTGCEDCGDGQLCVQNGDWMSFTQCAEVSEACAARPTCDCANACNAQCSDDGGISCFCVAC